MNMYDYLIWRGDLTFDRDPFNAVDNLLFSYAAYTDLREVITSDEPVTISQAIEAFFKLHTEEECLKSGSLIAHAPVIMRRMGASKRFGNVLITNYVRDINEQQSQQFSAMHFGIDKRTSYVAFCGTDDTIVGWKEDFQLSYKIVNAQLMAAEYLNRTVDKRLHRYIVGGHSKGGNLAVYGAMMATDAVKKKITAVYSNDGPGISDIAMDKKKFASIKGKLIKVIPEFSIFGLLFDNGEKRIVIESEKSGAYEHDAVGWMIQGNDFVRGTLSNDSLAIQDVVNAYLEALTLQEREELVDELYEAFVNAGIKNTTDFTQKGIPVILKFIREMTRLNDSADESVDKLVAIIKKTISEKASDKVKDIMNNIADSVPDFLKPASSREEEKKTTIKI